MARVIGAVLSLMLLSSTTSASEYCTKEQYQHDLALIENATHSGTVVKGPKGIRDSILVQEGMWFGMNYPQQIDFMQSFECALGGAGGKKLLYMDVRSLATGRLLATWKLGALTPAEESPNPTDPSRPGTAVDANRNGLTGEARAVFINETIDECNKVSNSTVCSCYANEMADTISIEELNELYANRNAGLSVLRPKIEAARQRCE
jgi:hypothetical protein